MSIDVILNDFSNNPENFDFALLNIVVTYTTKRASRFNLSVDDVIVYCSEFAELLLQY